MSDIQTYFTVSLEHLQKNYPKMSLKDWFGFTDAIAEFIDEYLFDFRADEDDTPSTPDLTVV